MTRHCQPFLLLFLSAGILLAAAPAWCQEDPAALLARIRDHRQAVREQVRQAVYLADSFTTITTADGRVEKTVASRREVTFTPPDQVEAHYLSMTVSGKALTAQEMEEEVKKSRGGKQGKSPFLPEEFPHYQFEVLGEKEWEGLPVWDVSFRPLAPAEGLAVGHAYILRDTLDEVYLQFSPSRLPGVMTRFEAELRHGPVEGFWLPAEFKLQFHLKVAFIFTLADKVIDVQERYSDYRLERSAP